MGRNCTTNSQECQPQFSAHLDGIFGIQQVSAARFRCRSQQFLSFCTLKCVKKPQIGRRKNSRMCSVLKNDIVNFVPDHAKFLAKRGVFVSFEEIRFIYGIQRPLTNKFTGRRCLQQRRCGLPPDVAGRLRQSMFSGFRFTK